MSVIIPMLLARASSEGESVYKETSARLLDLAGGDQGAFRAVIGGLSVEQKGFMESVILQGRQKVVLDSEEGKGEPSIALRMDFGV